MFVPEECVGWTSLNQEEQTYFSPDYTKDITVQSASHSVANVVRFYRYEKTNLPEQTRHTLSISEPRQLTVFSPQVMKFVLTPSSSVTLSQVSTISSVDFYLLDADNMKLFSNGTFKYIAYGQGSLYTTYEADSQILLYCVASGANAQIYFSVSFNMSLYSVNKKTASEVCFSVH